MACTIITVSIVSTNGTLGQPSCTDTSRFMLYFSQETFVTELLRLQLQSEYLLQFLFSKQLVPLCCHCVDKLGFFPSSLCHASKITKTKCVTVIIVGMMCSKAQGLKCQKTLLISWEQYYAPLYYANRQIHTYTYIHIFIYF